ncbi:RDD family protein [Thalassotalea profundi]|uniref:RDD domain-containing protein n=1 Tax=Thalassotalea profundi TaxID=2036687 RepID=A0ABQ3J6E8_9GAMM|nr:RDD family protein [Thalassotalea profundi]GHF01842.1 hypothetical protein GCM10011501_34050 [Thalassotalea profundi]
MSLEQSEIVTPTSKKIANTSDHTAYLTREETKQVLTPFAFEIDKSLFGLPLAAPRKRAIALLIDFVFISILAETPGELLALLAAVTFYRLGSKPLKTSDGKTVTRPKLGLRGILLRLLSAFILFFTVFSYISPTVNQWFTDDVTTQNVNQELSTINAFAVSAMTFGMTTEVENSECLTEKCWFELISPKLSDYADVKLPVKEMEPILKEVIEETSLTDTEQTSLMISLMAIYKELSESKEADEFKQANANTVNMPAVEVIKEEIEEPVTPKKEEQSWSYKGIEWVKGVIKDLGLSFGWAALYFSVLTSIWKGQTLGKRLMKVRVIQLDGTPLSVWDSFGRYGGYGAGLATGLLGFLQIYWDPNRQCIHDKISSTVVIDLKKLNKLKNKNN